MSRPRFGFLSALPPVLFVTVAAAGAAANAQPLLKSVTQVDPGDTKQSGATFGYRLTYTCSSAAGPCLNAEVVDLLPPQVQFVSTVPASPTVDVAAIIVTPNFMGSGRTRVRFLMFNPLPAGNSGDLIVNVRFPNGSTPNGTVASNTADGINLETVGGTFTTSPVAVTAAANVRVTLYKLLNTAPAHLDFTETYQLVVAVPNIQGVLNLTAIGPLIDALPPGTVFNGATPAADCEPGCVGTTPATLTWTSPCSVPLGPGQICSVLVSAVFPSGTFPSGTSVTNSVSADATPLGEAPEIFGPASVTHPVTTFVPSPGAALGKTISTGSPSFSPDPPTLNQAFSFDIALSNTGNVALDNMVLIDALPVEMQVTSVTTGAYINLTDFAAGEGVRVSYEKNTAPGVFTLWGSSPNTATNVTLGAPPAGLLPGEYLARLRWEFGQAQPGMGSATRPLITGRITNPDQAGGPVAIGDTIQNCVDLDAVYTAGPTNVTRNACRSFTLSSPFVQLNPAKESLSGGGPFNPGQTVFWRLSVRSDVRSSDPVPLETLVASDLLPVDLSFSSWTFDAQGTGLPAPQVFDLVPNFAGTGRTLLRWRWNAGSGNLGVNRQVWLIIATTVRNGASSGSLLNDFTLEEDAPALAQRCTGSSTGDVLDLDGDGETAELLCRATAGVTVQAFDFGDAADPSYPTLLASNGARHLVRAAGNPTLGTLVDTEGDGSPGPSAAGDDLAGSDDEDGVATGGPLVPGIQGTLSIIGGAVGGVVSCWIDFTRDGDWNDAGEQIVVDTALAGGGAMSPGFAVPVGSPPGTAPLRCRLSSQPGLGVTGSAPDGEVEDHVVVIGAEHPALGVAKRLVAVTRDAGGSSLFEVELELRLENTGNVPLTGLSASEDLGAAFAGAASFAVTSLASANFTVNPGFDGVADIELLAGGNAVAVGAAGTIALTVEVTVSGPSGPYFNSVLGSGESPAGTTVSDASQSGGEVDPDGDGDATNNDEPTIIALPLSVLEIPALGEWKLVLFALLIAVLAVRRLSTS